MQNLKPFNKFYYIRSGIWINIDKFDFIELAKMCEYYKISKCSNDYYKDGKIYLTHIYFKPINIFKYDIYYEDIITYGET